MQLKILANASEGIKKVQNNGPLPEVSVALLLGPFILADLGVLYSIFILFHYYYFSLLTS